MQRFAVERRGPHRCRVGRAEAGNPLCVDGKSAGYPVAKAQPELMETSPDLTFQGADGPIALHDYSEPCAARSRLLVVRIGAAWCRTCLWHLKHTADTKNSSVEARLQWLDLQLATRDNEPATVADLPAYRTLIDALIDAPEAVAVGPGFQLSSVDQIRVALPFIVLIDTRTMNVPRGKAWIRPTRSSSPACSSTWAKPLPRTSARCA